MLVLRQFLNDPATPHYGTELMRATGLLSGTMYPLLARLEKLGWLASSREDIDPVAAGRPRRRYYQLTPAGAARFAGLDGLRDYAERVSQESGAATVIVAVGTDPPHEFVVPPNQVAAYLDPVIGALIMATRQRVEAIGGITQVSTG